MTNKYLDKIANLASAGAKLNSAASKLKSKAKLFSEGAKAVAQSPVSLGLFAATHVQNIISNNRKFEPKKK